MRNLRDYILLFIKGILMGAADVIPGVSGGTVAFITGIYEELLRSIRSIDRMALQLLIKLEFAAFWIRINGKFLTILMAGIATSLFSLTKWMMYLIQDQAISVRAFFFGLILISTFPVLRDIRKWNGLIFLLFIIGVAISYSLTMIAPTHWPETLLFVFMAGTFVVCSLIFPGISLAFILLMLGQLKFITHAVSTFNIPVILVFLAGCLVGIVGFSRFLTWILDNYHSATVALLAGFMLGSLNKLWPWREVLEFVTNTTGEQIPVFDKSILPWHYMNTTHKDPQVFQAVFMIALGVLVVVLIEKIATRLKTKI